MKNLFINVRLKGNKELQSILINDGKFEKIGKREPQDDYNIIDLKGNLVVSPYVDPHIHLDYVFTAKLEGATNKTGTLFEGIQRWSETKSKFTKDDIKYRAKKAIKKEVLAGVQYIRTHVDVTNKNFEALEAILELKEELKDIVTIQIVSFPQEGMYAYKNGVELVEEGLKMGADCVGAIPHFEYAKEFGEKSIHKAVELALKYDRLIDVHCDETDDDQSRYVELLAALTYMEGIDKKTTASHTCSLGSANNAYVFRLMNLLCKTKMNFISCPTENIYLQGRQDTYPKRRGLTRVKELNDNHINVCFAQDSMSDPWYPLGNGNMMNILDHGIHICQMMSFDEIDNALDLITINGAKTMNLDDVYGIEVGKDANFIVINAKSEFEAVCERAGVLASIRNGKYLFNKIPEKVNTDIELLS